METLLRILILEDSVDDVELIEHQLKKGEFSYKSMVVESRESYEQALSEFKPDVILSDHSLPMFDSMLALQMFHSYRKVIQPAAVFILVTGTVSEEFAVQIMKNGADDYVLKDRLKRLPVAVKNAFEKSRLKEQRRKEEEEKLYLFDILQRSLHEIYVIDPENLHFKYANEEALNNLDYSLGELQNLKPSDVIEDFNEDQFAHALQLAMQRNKGLLLERNAIRRDRTLYPIQIHLQVIGQGKKRRILANVLDITEARELEEQKKLSNFIQNTFNHQRDLQESLEKVLEKICYSCSCVAAEAYFREFDQKSSRFLASYNKYKKGLTNSGRVLADKVYESKGNEKIGISEGSSDSYRNDLCEPWMATAKINSAVAIPIELGGEITAVIVGYLNKEVDEKKFSVLSDQVRQKLAGNIKRKKTEEELQKIFDFTPDILMVIGKDGYIRKVNPALAKILGYSSNEIISRSLEYFVHPDDKYILDKWRKRDLKKDEVANYESRWRTSDGQFRWFSWAVTPYMKGELHFAVGRDITASNRQLNAIKEQNRKLAEIAWEQSHIVRAPLTRLIACVQYLEEAPGDPEILSSVKNSAFEIDRVIRKIIYRSEKVDLNGKS